MVWYLVILNYYGAATYGPKPFQLEENCTQQAVYLNKVLDDVSGWSRAVCVAYER